MGPLDVELFALAARRVLEEFPVLRIYFRDEAGVPAQFVAPPWSPLSKVMDLSCQANPMDAALAAMRDAERRQFDPANPPLLDYQLLRLSADKFVWHTRYHVTLTDGIGCAMIARRLAEIYNAFLHASSPRPLGIVSLEMLVEDEARYLSSSRYQEDKLFWARYLKGCVTAILPRRAQSSATTIVRKSLRLPGNLSAAVTALARSTGLPVATVLIAATYLFVHRATSVPNFHLRLVVAAREGVWRRSPVRAANVVPLRVQISVTDGLATIARQVAAKLLELRHRWRFGGPELRLAAYETNGLMPGPSINVMSIQPISFGGNASIIRETFPPNPTELMIRWYIGADHIRLDLAAPGSLYRHSDLARYATGFGDILTAASAIMGRS